MDFVYFLENQGVQDFRSHTPLFQLILKENIGEDRVYSDMQLTRPELYAALYVLHTGDRLVVRSIQDLADGEDDLIPILRYLSTNSVELVSIEEPYLNGANVFKVWGGVTRIYQGYKDHARLSAYQQAREEGKVGRPPKSEQIARALKMLGANCFTIKEIEEYSGVSRATLYRYKGKET